MAVAAQSAKAGGGSASASQVNSRRTSILGSVVTLGGGSSNSGQIGTAAGGLLQQIGSGVVSK